MRKKCCCKLCRDFLEGYKWLAANYGNIDLSSSLSTVHSLICFYKETTELKGELLRSCLKVRRDEAMRVKQDCSVSEPALA